MKSLILLSLLFLVLPVAAQHDEQLAGGETNDSIARVAERMPLLLASNCSPEAPYPTRKSCSEQALQKYISTNLQYPSEASGTTGPAQLAVVNFVVEADGSITNVNISRDPGNGMGAEALRLVEQMAQETEWAPAMQGGEPIRLLMQLPVKFSKPD